MERNNSGIIFNINIASYLLIIFFTFISSALSEESSFTMDKEISVKRETREAFSAPIPNLSLSKMRFFTGGRHLFRRSWTPAPSSVKSLDGLGPVFNRVSCSGCHVKDGRGSPPPEGTDKFRSMVIKLGIIDNNALKPDPKYGFQLNDKSILGVPYEGKAKIHYDSKTIAFKDGSIIKLAKPKYSFFSLSFGKLNKNTKFSGRVAPAVFGLGLIEAIKEQDLLQNADPEDKNQDGISGRAHKIIDIVTNTEKIGKFGWKATRASLLHHISGAAFQDMGLTSSFFTKQNCMEIQIKCKEQINGGTPEISKKQMERLLIYMQTLAPPKQRGLKNDAIIKGNNLFLKIGCSNCHTPVYKTGEHKGHPELSNKIIKPYSDFLLHDMGPELDDGLIEGAALSSEWKTPPLWGIGLIKVVNRHTRFLHDGRARSIEEAILWHGGEAKASRNNYLKLKQNERNYILKFLNSL